MAKIFSRIIGGAKKMVKDRVQAQKNFRNRKQNSTYGNYKSFLKK